MEFALITMEKIVEMFLIMLIGVAACRAGIVGGDINKKLSGLLLNVVSPALIITSYQIEFKAELFQGLLATLGLSAVSFLAVILVTQLCLRPGSSSNVEIEKISMVYSNCGFIGIPLINGLLGKEGVFYMTAYLTVFNILLWSHGIILMCGRSSLKGMLKNFVTPSTIGIGIGIVLFLCRIDLPDVVANPLAMVGDMNTALAMIVAGGNLAESDLLGSLKRQRTYILSFLKLIVVPAMTVVILFFAGASRSVALTVLIGSACPAGASATMFALQFQKDSNYASELFTITTVLSLVTIPIVILCSNRFL